MTDKIVGYIACNKIGDRLFDYDNNLLPIGKEITCSNSRMKFVYDKDTEIDISSDDISPYLIVCKAEIYAVDDQCNITKFIILEACDELPNDMELDKFGDVRVVRMSIEEVDGEYKYNMEFDDRGDKIYEHIDYTDDDDYDDNFTSETKYTYDNDRKLIMDEYCGRGDKFRTRYKYDLNEDDTLTRTDSIGEQVIVEYSKLGKIVESDEMQIISYDIED